ncbi:hypothetical protein KW797_00580 [Candidatus Parcubacteria bacterium]|nr:hypothetical protein [Candidatus Parcubacteria bacterium]
MRTRGFALLEIVIGASIISLSLLGVLSVAKDSLRVSEHSLREAESRFLLEEGAEAIRSMRDNGWSALSGLATSSVYYLAFTAPTTTARFATSSQNTYIDGLFERSFTVSDVYRDSNDRIAPSGTQDSGTKKFTVNVSWWSRSATTTRTVQFYLSNV